MARSPFEDVHAQNTSHDVLLSWFVLDDPLLPKENQQTQDQTTKPLKKTRDSNADVIFEEMQPNSLAENTLPSLSIWESDKADTENFQPAQLSQPESQERSPFALLRSILNGESKIIRQLQEEGRLSKEFDVSNCAMHLRLSPDGILSVSFRNKDGYQLSLTCSNNGRAREGLKGPDGKEIISCLT